MKRRILLLSVAALAFSCSTPKTQESAVDTVASVPALPALTDAQKAEGWKLLFDGTTTTGWHFFKGKENNTWEVQDGALHCKAEADKRADLVTDGEYTNFELSFDWKVAKGSNSGVMFHVTEEFDEPYFSGPEYQVIDDANYPGELKDTQLAAANYDMHAVPTKKAAAFGEWNSSRLVVNGSHVEHWLNGEQVLTYELWSDDWTKRKNGSKWKDVKGYGMSKKGKIDLQDHGNEVWYRNIAIKELP